MTTLTTPQKTELEKALAAQRRQLVSEIRTGLQESGDQSIAELAGRVHDAADEAVADVLADVSAARLDREINELRATESALTRLADGTYGDCADCGNAIAFARLMAYPTADRCVACQTRHEQNQGKPPRL